MLVPSDAACSSRKSAPSGQARRAAKAATVDDPVL
jgi:hypothetical protein